MDEGKTPEQNKDADGLHACYDELMAQTENFWHLRLAIDFHQYCPMSNHPVEIVKDFSIAQAEEILRRLSKRPDSVLRLPLRLDRPKFAARSSLNQLLITWAKQGRVREIQTYLGSGVTNEGISEQFLRMRDQGFGIIAGLLAKRILGQGGQDLTQKCRDHLLKYLDATHNRTRTSKRTRSLFLCDDTAGLNFHPLLYTGFAVGQPPQVAPDEDMEALVQSFLDFTIDYRNDKRASLTKERIAGLGGILHELFKNTDDWAKPPFASEELSLRGISFESYIQFPTSRVNAVDWIKDCPPLKGYYDSITNNGLKRSSFIEISVFDSGPGIAKRWLQNKHIQQDLIPSEIAQYEAVTTAFRKWSTSSENAGRGKGLDRVLRLLTTLGGFFYLRTDGLSLYRDLVNDAHKTEDYNSPVIIPGRFPLKDWNTQGKQLSDLPRIEGVLISMLIPLDDPEND